MKWIKINSDEDLPPVSDNEYLLFTYSQLGNGNILKKFEIGHLNKGYDKPFEFFETHDCCPVTDVTHYAEITPPDDK